MWWFCLGKRCDAPMPMLSAGPTFFGKCRAAWCSSWEKKEEATLILFCWLPPQKMVSYDELVLFHQTWIQLKTTKSPREVSAFWGRNVCVSKRKPTEKEIAWGLDSPRCFSGSLLVGLACKETLGVRSPQRRAWWVCVFFFFLRGCVLGWKIWFCWRFCICFAFLDGFVGGFAFF